MSLKCLDNKNRWRSKTVAFRISPEEWEQLNIFVSLSGLQKQDYLIKRVLQKDIIVNGSPRTYKALCNQLSEVHQLLQSLSEASDISDEMLTVISQIVTTLGGMSGDQNG